MKAQMDKREAEMKARMDKQEAEIARLRQQLAASNAGAQQRVRAGKECRSQASFLAGVRSSHRYLLCA